MSRCMLLPGVLKIPKIANAAMKRGLMTEEQLRSALSWGTSPLLIVEMLDSSGLYVLGEDIIRIAKRHVDHFEAGTGKIMMIDGRRVHEVEILILHELVHWADYMPDKHFDYKFGARLFEMEAYNKSVSLSNLSDD